MHRRSALSLAISIACLVAAAPASARIPIRVGIGDQQVSMFDNPAFQRAKLKRVRYIVPWNVMANANGRLAARAFVQRARRDGLQVLLHVSTDDYAIKHGHRPSVAEYHADVGRLVRYFRGLGVRDFGVWDEANHASQPTYDSPNHAALYFVEMYRAVKGHCSTCGVVALDVLDQDGVERYMRSFYRRLSATYRRRATVVGIHNYGDVNRKRTTFTRAIIQEAHHYNRHTRFWLTETGGIVKFGGAFPFSLVRAEHRLSEMFSIAKRYRASGIERMYVYQWTGAQLGDRFDAGLTNPDGSVRPAYTYLRKKLPDYER
jgi:hypothetical protein